MTTLERALAYARFFEGLFPASRDRLRELVHPNIRFVDPFNDVRGVDKLLAIFDHMFETTSDARFITDPPVAAANRAFIKWRFTCTIQRRFYHQEMAIDGVTEVQFDETGLIIAHIDYWDAASQLYEKFPLLGRLLRAIRRHLAVPG